MKMPTHKIEAIKIIRDLPVAIKSEVINRGYGEVTVNVARIDIGLKEAKDLVEAIMAIQQVNYSFESQKAEIEKLKSLLSDAENRLIHLRVDIQGAVDKSYPPSSTSDYDNEPSF